MQKITTSLWFDSRAEEAANFYISVFKNSKLGQINRYGEGAPKPNGSVLSVSFSLDGHDFIAINSGPHYQFTPAISLFINCENQEEVDAFWAKLGEGGKPLMCGWITDKFGLTWQVVPKGLDKLLYDADAAKAKRAMDAMMKMVKLDIAVIRKAHEGK